VLPLTPEPAHSCVPTTDPRGTPMIRTTLALNLAPVAGAARPCAVAGLAGAGFAGVMSDASSYGWHHEFINATQTTKRPTRRHRPPLT
jgi:hypothetical protein